ncbi:MAG: substrate-binding domain-containing protein [Anaerolineaceae bacterium]|nr:substrate-binding domain-containing protein [Anaerolineaceae bacterium]
MKRSGLNYSPLILFLITAMVSVVGCNPSAPQVSSGKLSADAEVILATTTSTRDSGLLDVLLPLFEEQTGYQVKLIAAGSGQALAMAEAGNADVVLAHAPSAEMELMQKGVGRERFLVMHNDFVIVGPAADPAGVINAANVNAALAAIYRSQSQFISRGDDSGTHKMEMHLWDSAGLSPGGEWYLQSGQGMGETLRIASEKMGYTLTDRGTYLALRSTLDMDVLFEGDASLLNLYHVLTINPEKVAGVNYAGARALADFLVGAPAQRIIAVFGVENYGRPLFIPGAEQQPDELGG